MLACQGEEVNQAVYEPIKPIGQVGKQVGKLFQPCLFKMAIYFFCGGLSLYPR